MASTDIITEIFALVGFKIDDKPLAKFSAKIYGTVALLARITDEATRAIVSLDNLNKTLGIGSDVLREWGFIAEQSNVKADSVIQAFQTIAKARGDMLAGRGFSNAWALLGVDPSQDPEQVFNEVLQKLGQIEDINLRNTRIADLGFDPQLVNLIGKTRQNLDGIFKDLQVTEKEKNSLLELKKSFVNLRITFLLLKEKFVSAFFPIQLAIDLITRLSQLIYKIADNTLGWGNAIKVVVVILAGFFAYLNPIKALLIAIGLVIEDVWTYLQGGESITGIIIDKFKQLGVIGKNVFNGIKETIKNLISMIKSLIDIVQNSLVNAFKKAGNFISAPFEKMKSFFGKRVSANIGENLEPSLNTNAGISTINNNPNIINNFNIDGSQNPQATANEIFNYQEQLNETSLMYQ